MNSAEYRTLHDALGMSTAKLAELSGTTSRMIWHWESAERDAPVPDEAAEAIMRLALLRLEVSESLVLAFIDGKILALPRYRTAEAFDAAYPSLAGWGLSAQGLLLAQAAIGLQIEGYPNHSIEWVAA